jgi:hypothetical protein
MNANRRTFIAAAGLSAAWIAGNAGGASAEQADAAAPSRIDGLTCLDYGRSFICNTAAFNSVRFWVESRTVLFDGERQSEFYQCGSCKSENTFGEKDLFLENNYDFLPILGEGRWLIFRRTARLNPNYRQIRTIDDVWGPVSLKLREARKLRELETWEAVRDATAAAVPIVARTVLENNETGLRAVIECPVKTMNISLEKQMYQVDTGPIAFPDLSRRYDPQIDCLHLAFVAFNAPHFADFVREQPTSVEDKRDGAQIHHYSERLSFPAKNRLLAIEDA